MPTAHDMAPSLFQQVEALRTLLIPTLLDAIITWALTRASSLQVPAPRLLLLINPFNEMGGFAVGADVVLLSLNDAVPDWVASMEMVVASGRFDCWSGYPAGLELKDTRGVFRACAPKGKGEAEAVGKIVRFGYHPFLFE